MSGVKLSPIQILERDLTAARSKIVDVERQRELLENQMQAIRKRTEREISELGASIEHKVAETRRENAKLKGAIRDLEFKNVEMLAKQQASFTAAIRNSEARIDQRVTRIEEFVTAELTQVNSMLEDQEQRIGRIEDAESNRTNQAKEFIAGLRDLVETFDSVSSHKKFAPGKLREIQDQIAIATSNLSNGNSQAALSVSQSTYFEFARVRQEVALRESEFEMTYIAVSEDVERLNRWIEGNSALPSNLETEPLKLEFWSDGRYSEIAKSASALWDSLVNQKQYLSTHQVQSIHSQCAELESKFNDIMQAASTAIALSAIRAELGNTIMDVLEDQHSFSVDIYNSGFEGGDKRRTVVLEFSHPSGTKLTVLIIPDGNSGSNQIVFKTEDENPLSARFQAEWFQEIRSSLRKKGVDLGEPTEATEQLEELYDVGNLVEQGASLPKAVRDKVRQLVGGKKG